MVEENNITNDDIEAINKDIEDAKNKLVSKETESKIAQAKEEAKKEAEKEFLINQKIKELEEEKKKLLEQIETNEKESAEKISKLAEKVNSYVESRVPVSNDNPFGSKSNGSGIDALSDADIDKMEQDSFQAFLEEKVRKEE